MCLGECTVDSRVYFHAPAKSFTKVPEFVAISAQANSDQQMGLWLSVGCRMLMTNFLAITSMTVFRVVATIAAMLAIGVARIP